MLVVDVRVWQFQTAVAGRVATATCYISGELVCEFLS
jgi:hypothetical protein